MAAREVAVSALGTVYALSQTGDELTGALSTLIQQAWSLPTALSLMTWYVFAPQCLSTLIVVRRETNGWKMPLVMTAYLFVLAYAASWVVFHLARLVGPESAIGGHHVGIHPGSQWPLAWPAAALYLAHRWWPGLKGLVQNTPGTQACGQTQGESIAEPIGCPMGAGCGQYGQATSKSAKDHRIDVVKRTVNPHEQGPRPRTRDNQRQPSQPTLGFIHHQSQAYPPNRPVMRPLFAIAPLAFVLAFFSPSTAEVSANFESFKAMFASSNKAAVEPQTAPPPPHAFCSIIDR